ncbi:MAG: glycosyl transferase, partial [Planktothrix sp.]
MIIAIILTAGLTLISLALAIPVSVFFTECLAALIKKPPLNQKVAEIDPKIAVLIPAHNEASG